MRRIEHLINDVRFSTNEKSNRFPNARFNKLFNDAQQEIQRLVHISNTDSKFFAKEAYQDLVNGQEEYFLPVDVYTHSAINSMARRVTQDSNGTISYSTLRYLTEKERRTGFGYIIQGKRYLLTPIPRVNLVNGVRINYTAKIAELATRVGKIANIAAGVITLTGFDAKIDVTDFNDYFCIVDKDGEIIDQEMDIVSYVKATGVLTTSSTISASVGSYVVLGKVATSNSVLPDACEKYMTMFVERAVHYINSSRGDLEAANVFSAEEKSDIELLFAKNENDVKYPPIVDNNYLNL